MRRISLLLIVAMVAAACGGTAASPFVSTTGSATSTTTTAAAVSSTTTTSVPTSTSTTTTAATSTTTTTTTIPLPTTEVPDAVSVDRLEWEGTVAISGVDADARYEGTLHLTGAYESPVSHRVYYVQENVVVDRTDDSTERGTTMWDGVVIGDLIWFSTDDGGFELEPWDDDSHDGDLGLLSTALDAVIPSPEVLDDLRGREWTAASSDGVEVMSFRIPDAPLDLYGPLFGSALATDPIPGATTGDLMLLLDPATGVVREASLSVSGEDAGTAWDVALEFRVTASDSSAAGVYPPMVEPFDVPEGMLPFADAAGRFRVAVPAGWTMEQDEESFAFLAPGDDSYAVVIVQEVAPGTTPDQFTDEFLASGEEGLVDRSHVERGGSTWVRLEGGEGDVWAFVWLTVVGETGVGVVYAAPAESWSTDGAVQAEAVFASFQFLGP